MSANAINPTTRRSTTNVHSISSAREKRDKGKLVPNEHVYAVALQALSRMAYLEGEGRPLVFATRKEFHKGVRAWIEKKVILRDRLPRRARAHQVAFEAHNLLISKRFVVFNPRRGCKSPVVITPLGRARLDHPSSGEDTQRAEGVA